MANSKRPKRCGDPTPDEVCMSWFEGGCLECARQKSVWHPIRDRLSAKLEKARAAEYKIQAESEHRLKTLEELSWKEAWREYKVRIAKTGEIKGGAE